MASVSVGTSIEKEERRSSSSNTDMAFLASLAASEDFTYHRSFSKQYVYRDLYNERPTKVLCTNSDLAFTGGWHE